MKFILIFSNLNTSNQFKYLININQKGLLKIKAIFDFININKSYFFNAIYRLL